jgi:hypothetical protein
MFQQKQQQTPNNPLDMLDQIRQQGPSNVVFNQMYQNNPQFKQFADSMRGKTPQQAFQENGLDFNQFKNMKW